MAYDANDPADKKILEDAVKAALEEAKTEHEAEVDRLKGENAKVRENLRKARADGGADNAAEIAKLEGDLDRVSGELRTAQSELREANRNLTKANADLATTTTALKSEQAFSHETLVTNGLTQELVAAKVAPDLLPGAVALLRGQVTVKAEGDTRRAVVGDKSLADFVKDWSQGDQGKPYIKAPLNGGGDAQGGGGGGGAKPLNDMSEAERTTMARENPTGWAALLRENGRTT
jgi:hypothetical protein